VAGDLLNPDAPRHAGFTRALDIGCGAGRNAVPLARGGWISCSPFPGIRFRQPRSLSPASRSYSHNSRANHSALTAEQLVEELGTAGFTRDPPCR
jgi:hypothetical protein